MQLSGKIYYQMGPPTSGHPPKLILNPIQEGLQICPREASYSDPWGQCGTLIHINKARWKQMLLDETSNLFHAIMSVKSPEETTQSELFEKL